MREKVKKNNEICYFGIRIVKFGDRFFLRGLCVFAGDIPRFACGSTELALYVIDAASTYAIAAVNKLKSATKTETAKMRQ